MNIDGFDLRLLHELQRNSALSQRELADRVGLSQNACWRRLQRLTAEGFIKGASSQINLAALGFELTVLVMVRTRSHSKEWVDHFRKHVEKMPEVIDFHRIGGDWDYMIKIATRGMAGYDRFYQRLIANVELERVTGLFSMEAIVENRPPDLLRLMPQASPASKKSGKPAARSRRRRAEA